MAIPTLMFEHALDYLKGWWDEHALDYDANLSANVTVDPVYGGTCVHVNSSHEFELGAIDAQMPMFLIQGSNDPDVSLPGGNNWQAVSPSGKQSAVVATGGYELETTEFYQTAGLTYYPNDRLHAPVEAQITGTDKSLAGNLFKARSWPGGSAAAITNTAFADHICGIVSRQNHNNAHRVPVVSFWPYFLPGTSNS